MKRYYILILITLFVSITIAFAKEEDFPAVVKQMNNLVKSDFVEKFKANPHKKTDKDNCLLCHQTGSPRAKKPVTDFKGSIHQEVGLHCSDCHGGNSAKFSMEAMGGMFNTKPNGFIGKPKRKDISLMCARCHSNAEYMKNYNPKLPVDQLTKYMTSTHGKQMIKGKDVVAVCSDCHGSHSILPKNKPTSMVYAVNVPATCGQCHNDKEKMKKYGTKKETKQANQFTEYINSVHGKVLLKKQDVSAPACNDCHGNHGATPPGVDSVSMSCKQCHPRNAELFTSGTHFLDFSQKGLPQCATCHTKHNIKSPSHAFVKKDTACADCHSKNDLKTLGTKIDKKFNNFDELVKSYTPEVKQQSNLCFKCHQDKSTKSYQNVVNMQNNLTKLLKDIHRLNQSLHNSENRGVEVSGAKSKLDQLKRMQVELRTIHHKADYTLFHTKVNEKKKERQEVEAEAKKADEEYFSRRNWLILASTVITLLIIILIIKIRSIEKEDNA